MLQIYNRVPSLVLLQYNVNIISLDVIVYLKDALEHYCDSIMPSAVSRAEDNVILQNNNPAKEYWNTLWKEYCKIRSTFRKLSSIFLQTTIVYGHLSVQRQVLGEGHSDLEAYKTNQKTKLLHNVASYIAIVHTM